MAQNQRKKKSKTSGSSGNGKVILYILLVVVGLAGAVSLGTAGGNKPTTSDSVVTVPGGVAPAEYQKVSVTGETLSQIPESGTDPEVGKAAPTLTGYDLFGRPVTVDPGSDGKATLVVFLAHWCPHCNREVPVLNDWKAQGLVPANLRIVGITTASKADQANWPPSKWIVAMKWSFDQFADSEKQDAAAAYGVSGYPYLAFIDAKGNITSRASGEIPIDELTAAAKKAVGEK